MEHVYLHHEKKRIESNEDHDEVLKRGRHHYFPDAVLDGVLVLGRVATRRFGIDDEFYALFL